MNQEKSGKNLNRKIQISQKLKSILRNYETLIDLSKKLQDVHLTQMYLRI